MGRDGRNGRDGRAGARDRRVARVREQIDFWRRTRPRRTRMPEELWAAAVSLAGAGGVYAVARDLGVSYETLRARVLERAADDGRGGVGPRFVELPGLGSAESGSGVVELERGDGARMTIRLPAGGTMDVAELSAAFLARR